jgi:hypothetical protein
MAINQTTKDRIWSALKYLVVAGGTAAATIYGGPAGGAAATAALEALKNVFGG